MYLKLLKKCTISGKEYKAGTKIGLTTDVAKELLKNKLGKLIKNNDKEKVKIQLSDLKKEESKNKIDKNLKQK